jgi:hypothetical protein
MWEETAFVSYFEIAGYVEMAGCKNTANCNAYTALQIEGQPVYSSVIYTLLKSTWSVSVFSSPDCCAPWVL